jgi:dipeptidyl aminopeptidase/acylaminoacyl peptidase
MMNIKKFFIANIVVLCVLSDLSMLLSADDAASNALVQAEKPQEQNEKKEKIKKQSPYGDSYFATLSWHPDGRHLVLANNDHGISVYRLDALSGAGLCAVRYGVEDISGFGCTAAWSPDGQHVVTASGYGMMKFYKFLPDRPDIGLQPIVSSVADLGNISVFDIAWSPCGHLIAVSGIDKSGGVIKIYHVATASKKITHVCSAACGVFVDQIAWSPDGQNIVAGYYAQRNDGVSNLRLYRFVKQQKSLEPVGGAQQLPFFVFSSLAWHPSGQFVATSSKYDARIKVYQIAENDAGFYPAGAGLVERVGWCNSSIAWSSDGRNLFALNYLMRAHDTCVSAVTMYDFRPLVDTNNGGGLLDAGIGEPLYNVYPLSVSWNPRGRYVAVMHFADEVKVPQIKIASTVCYKNGVIQDMGQGSSQVPEIKEGWQNPSLRCVQSTKKYSFGKEWMNAGDTGS